MARRSCSYGIQFDVRPRERISACFWTQERATHEIHGCTVEQGWSGARVVVRFGGYSIGYVAHHAGSNGLTVANVLATVRRQLLPPTSRGMSKDSPSIQIYKMRDHDGSVRELEAHFDGAGDLILSGWDFGPGTAAILGREEYEYWVRVRAEHLPYLLLELLRVHFATAPGASSEFMKLLDRIAVPYGFSTWSEETAQPKSGEGRGSRATRRRE